MENATDSYSMTDFCNGYIPAGLSIANLAWWFLLAALIAGVVAAILEAVVKIQEAAHAEAERAAGAQRGILPVKDMVEVLKGLLDSFAKAPLWLALFAVGILVFWVPGSAVSGACGPEAVSSAGGAAPAGPDKKRKADAPGSNTTDGNAAAGDNH